MINLKLDIEEELLRFANTEFVVKIYNLSRLLASPQEMAENEFQDCEEVVDPENPFYQLCIGLIDSFDLKTNVKVFEGGENRVGSLIGCTTGDEFIYFFYHPRLLEYLESHEILLLLKHELGHYYFRNDLPLEKMACSPIIMNLLDSAEKKIRFKVIASLISHISEYNADRFVAFNIDDLEGYKNIMKKIYKIDSEQNPNYVSSEVRKKNIDKDWKNKFNSTHPLIEDRITALDYIEKHIHNKLFNINESTEVYNKMLELLSYNEFMQEYGDYYEERLKSINLQQKI